MRPITWTGMDPTRFTNAEQIHQAAAMGKITIGDVVRRFECPLIPEGGRRPYSQRSLGARAARG